MTQLKFTYSDTLKLVARAPGLCAARLAERAGVRHAAMCKRLGIMREHGLVRSTKDGRVFLWFVKE